MTKQTDANSDYSGLEELLNSEIMKNYNSFIVSLAMKYAPHSKTVVDFGAGIGTMSLIFRDKFKIQPFCLEIDETNKEYLEKRGFEIFYDLSTLENKVDLIFSSNVLEHIDDDVSVLRDMKTLLTEDGKIFLYLPAKMLLWTKLDESVGHYRRYEYSELIEKCKQVGLTIDKVHFADSIGLFASLAMKVFGYNKDAGIGSVSSLRFYDKWLLPLSILLDKVGFKHLFGKNIVLVARK
tara:strand:- start:301 stop:1011 length:711 start_codon:yes stop_codon:yes gene_type:complete